MSSILIPTASIFRCDSIAARDDHHDNNACKSSAQMMIIINFDLFDVASAAAAQHGLIFHSAYSDNIRLRSRLSCICIALSPGKLN